MKSMKKNVLMTLAALALAAAQMNAQDIAIGFKGGVNIPKITAGGHDNTPLSEGYASRLAGTAGVFGEFGFTKVFSLRVGFEYSGQGGQKEGFQAIPRAQVLNGLTSGLSLGMSYLKQQFPSHTDEINQFSSDLNALKNEVAGEDKYFYADFKSTAKFNYLMVPVQAKFAWKLGPESPCKVYVAAGIFGAYLLSGKRVSEGTSRIYLTEDKSGQQLYDRIGPPMNDLLDGLPDDMQTQINTIASMIETRIQEPSFNQTQDITDDLYRFNYGFIGAAGISYSFGRSAIFLEGGGNYGFVKIQKSEANGQNRIGAGTVTVGYMCKLGK